MQQATMFMYKNVVKVYGPVNIPHQTCVITRKQQINILNTCGIWPAIVDIEEWGEEWGIWVGSACTRQCRHALAIGRDLERSIDLSRLLDEIRPFDEAYAV